MRGLVFQMAMSAAEKKARAQARALIERNDELLRLAGDYFSAQSAADKTIARYDERAAGIAAARDSELAKWRAARARAATAMIDAGASRPEVATRLGITVPKLSKLLKADGGLGGAGAGAPRNDGDTAGSGPDEHGGQEQHDNANQPGSWQG